MKKTALVITAAAFLATTNVAYAAKSEFASLLKEEKAQAKVERQVQKQTETSKPASVVEKLANKAIVKAQKMADRIKQKAVRKVYLYEQEVIDAVVDGRAEYEVWGQMNYNFKKGKVNANAHYLTPEAVYALQYGGETIAEGTANEEGDVHFKGTYTFDVEAFDAHLLTIVAVSGDEEGENTTVLVGHPTKIKHLETEMEDDAMSETNE